MPRPGDHRLDLVLRSGKESLHRAVATIAHPAAELARARFVGERVAKSHTLHAAVDHDAARDPRRRFHWAFLLGWRAGTVARRPGAIRAWSRPSGLALRRALIASTAGE